VVKDVKNIYGLKKKTCLSVLEYRGDTWTMAMQQVWRREGGI